MKKYFFILILTLISIQLSFARIIDSLPFTGQNKQSNPIYWDVKEGGEIDTALIDTTKITLSQAGDTYRSFIYPIYGKTSFQIFNSIGSTISYIVQILAANRQTHLTDYSNSEVNYTSIPDSAFNPVYWLHCEGSGLDSTYVNTVKDSIITKVNTCPISLPIYGYDAVRFEVIVGGDHSGNMDLTGTICRWEDQK